MANFNPFKTTNPSFWDYPRAGVPGWKLDWPGNVWDALMDAIGAAVAGFVPYVPLGVTVPVTPGASPWTYTAGTAPEIVYISGGSINSITRNGTQITTAGTVTVLLPPLGAVTIDFDLAPTVVVDK